MKLGVCKAIRELQARLVLSLFTWWGQSTARHRSALDHSARESLQTYAGPLLCHVSSNRDFIVKRYVISNSTGSKFLAAAGTFDGMIKTECVLRAELRVILTTLTTQEI